MLYPQLPDPNGWDVGGEDWPLLADDFQCQLDGPITEVTIWGSWWSDDIGAVTNLHLSIHTDDRTGPFSKPGELLWEWEAEPADIAVTPETPSAQGWFDPWIDYVEPMNHSQYFRYVVTIPVEEAFVQRNGTIYWLDVRAETEGGGPWGWKTSRSPHFEDDAVWATNDTQGLVYWHELIDPETSESLDLAFVINGEAAEEDVDWGDAPDPTYPTLFNSLGANHTIVPGVFLGAAVDAEMDGQPSSDALGDDLSGTDDEDGVTFTTLMQTGTVATAIVTGPVPGFLDAWVDFGGDGVWDEPQDRVAGGPFTPPSMPVAIPVPIGARPGQTFARFRFNTAAAMLPSTGPAPDGEVEDYRVYIDGDLPTNKMHYPQLPDPNGWDVGGEEWSVLADDFLCTSNGPITEVTIWGSWYDDSVGLVTNIHLSIHTDDRTGPFSKPGELLWEWEAADFMVIEEPQSEQGWFDPWIDYVEPANHVQYFKYVVDVPVEQAYVQQEGTIYWLDVRADIEGGGPWGWKTSRSPHFEDDAVWATNDMRGMTYWNELIDPFTGESLDLAFVINEKKEPEPDLLDFGDAPDPTYPTLLANNGASHVIGGPWLGDPNNGPDDEPDGQPDANALGDDLDTDPGNPGPNYDDELGVWFPTMIQGVSTGVTVVVSGGGGVVEIWLDENINGAWEVAEQIWNGFLPDGTNSIAWAVSDRSGVGSTFARCRISRQGTGSPDGPAVDGEVEDHNVFIENGVIGWCDLQWPPVTTSKVGKATEDIYGQVWISGVTSNPGPTPHLVAQIGYGLRGTDARSDMTWVWANAAYHLDSGNNDEFVAQLTIDQAGLYDYVYRYSRDGMTWTYGDFDPGTADGYAVVDQGHLTVVANICEKWVQEPDCLYGLDLKSWAAGPPTPGEPIEPFFRVADDWLCDGRPITTVRWWGSYLRWEELVPTPVEPPAQGLDGVSIVGFRLTWLTDIPDPDGEGPGYSQPGVEITNAVVYLPPFGGDVLEEYYCTTELDYVQPGLFEHEYMYTAHLPSPWNEKEGNVYWLMIEAVYLDGQSGGAPPVYEWGWKTAPVEENWNDDAVFRDMYGGAGVWEELTYPPRVEPWATLEVHPYMGESVNMAFELYSDVCPRRCVKWRQPVNMVDGTDMESWRWVSSPHVLRADDFISDGRPITDIHWWGSYLNWRFDRPGSEGDPVRPPALIPLRPLGFNLSWHAHDEQTGLPGAPLTNIFVDIDQCHEVYYGMVDQTDWYEGVPHFEHEYQYYVDLLNVTEEPWHEEEGVHYWLDIEAVFDDGFRPDEGPLSHAGWGWKITLADAGQAEWSAVSNVMSIGWAQDGLTPPHPRVGESFDLSFELTTTNVPHAGSFIGSDVRFTDLVVDINGDTAWLWSTGYCGCGVQILQESSNLTNPSAGMVDIATNQLPLSESIWMVDPVGDQRFYRIIETE